MPMPNFNEATSLASLASMCTTLCTSYNELMRLYISLLQAQTEAAKREDTRRAEESRQRRELERKQFEDTRVEMWMRHETERQKMLLAHVSTLLASPHEDVRETAVSVFKAVSERRKPSRAEIEQLHFGL
jgi:catalase